MVEEDSCGEGHNPVTLETEPAPAPPCCMPGAQACDRKVPPLPQLFCSLQEGDRGPEPGGSQTPPGVSTLQADSFLGKAGSQTSAVSKQRTE